MESPPLQKPSELSPQLGNATLSTSLASAVDSVKSFISIAEEKTATRPAVLSENIV